MTARVRRPAPGTGGTGRTSRVGRVGHRLAWRALAATTAACLGVALTPALAEAAQPQVTTVARVRATVDGRFSSAFAFRIWVGDRTGVAASNTAAAYADCRLCRGVAVSLQVVVQGHVSTGPHGDGDGDGPGDVRVANVAVARDGRLPSAGGNDAERGRSAVSCQACSTTALAYQFVVVSTGTLSLTPAARNRIRALAAQMRAVPSPWLTNAQIVAREDALAAQVAAVLRGGVVKTGS